MIIIMFCIFAIFPDSHVKKRRPVALVSGLTRVNKIAAERGPLYSRLSDFDFFFPIIKIK